MKQLSIIIPIYNVEKYVHTCLNSIFRQGIDDEDFEVILVNDGTPDKSMEVIADIIDAHRNIHVIEQENQGISVARNNGLQIAKGDYILFLDSDDLLINNTVSFLLKKAISSEVDLVVADFIKMNDDQITQFPNKPFTQKNVRTKVKTGEQLLLQYLDPHYCCVWRTMYRREFLNKNNLRFIPHVYFEDVPFTHQCYLNASLCLRVNWPFIIYRRGHESITSSFNLKKGKDYCTIIEEMWRKAHDKTLNNQIRQKLQDHVFVYFSILFYALTSCTTIPRSEKMFFLSYLKKNVPDLVFKNGIKQNFVTLLYQRMPSVYMTLRIFYANYLQNIFWFIGDTIRHTKN